MRFLFSFFLVLTFFPVLAANPAQQEDARIEREKILKTADRLEVLLPQMEALKSEVQSLKTQVDRLQLENATLKKSLSALETSRTKEREALLDEVSKILSESHSTKPTAKSAIKPSSTNATLSASKPTVSTTNQTKEQVGYEHVVGPGQTVSSIAKAFNESGVKVSVNDIIKANNLGSDAKVRVGQKLFIPKK